MELAKVHEYEVMWTSQLTQKIKKWNDGTLKFHTFNKRAMLYDSSGIFVVSSVSLYFSASFVLMRDHLGRPVFEEASRGRR
jgi:hypothetical protein